MKIGNFHFGRLQFWRFLLFGFLIGMIVLIGAYPYWDGSPWENINYWNENGIVLSSYNFSAVVLNSSDSSTALIYKFGGENISSSIYGAHPPSFFDWINLGSDTGILSFNSSVDNRTGAYNVSIDVYYDDDTTSIGAKLFQFIINATNDYPEFANIESEYNLSQDVTFSEFINGTDEEGHYPLYFNVSFIPDNCTHASWSGMNDNEDCSLFDFGFNSSSSSNTSALLVFTPSSTHVGTYWANVSVVDYNSGCPSIYCDSSSYEQNLTSYYSTLVKFTILSSLDFNVSNCTGQSLTEGDWLNCTIEIMTVGETDNVSVSSLAFFRNDSSDPHNSSWFKGAEYRVAENFVIPVNISILLEKKEVGNWTVNFSADDGDGEETPRPVTHSIYLFINYSESSVSLDSISDVVALYSNTSFNVNAYDEDLWIRDGNVRDEQLVYASNVSWVSVTSPTSYHNSNYTTSLVSVDYDNISALGDGNYSVLINVTDIYGNFANRSFVVEILSDTAPDWNLTEIVSLNLTEDVAFYYNVSVNVSDIENDAITFYYENVSEEFCSLNSSTFNSSSGVINFIPTDCDVGYHNVTIIAGDGKLNSSWGFGFSVSNVGDAPGVFSLEGDNGTAYSLTEGFNFVVTEDEGVDFSLIIADDDFLIPQKDYYNESLAISVNATNSSGAEVSLFNFSFVQFGTGGLENVEYNATFTPSGSQVDSYTIFINIVDNNGNFTNRTFYLNITASNDAPNLTAIENLSLAVGDVLDLDIDAIDEEDGNDSLGLLTFSLDFVYGEDFVNGDESIFNSSSGVFNLSLNSSHAGEYHINVTVNDSLGEEDWQVFYLYIYGAPNITSPSESYVFSWKENNFGNLSFGLDYSINNSNLSYEFSMDNIIYYWMNESNNSKSFNYSNLTLREAGSFVWNSSTNLSFDYLPSYDDESYGMLKNFSLLVYNADYPELNDSLTWRVNVSHTNENLSFTPTISKKGPVSLGSAISVDLGDYFNDSDYFDVYYNQKVNFTLETVGAGGYVVLGSSFSGWTLNLESSIAAKETVKITAYEWSDTNTSLGNVTSNDFEVEFIEPVVVTVSSSGGSSGSSTKLKFYSLRVIVPKDVIISDENYIDIPFGLENSGTIDLVGIDLSSTVLYNNQFSDDVKIQLGETYIASLKSGERKDYTMRILADTDRSGKYKATLFANITSPKFNDWGDFFIDLRKTNDSEAEQLLVFTEKIIADNPECLELTELFRKAKEVFERGDEAEAVRLAMEVSNACEDAISANEQVRYRIEGLVERNFYYISFLTLFIFFVGFIFYVYKKVRFNKSGRDEYIR